MPLTPLAIDVLDQWYGALPLYQDRLPARGSISNALFVLHRLKQSYELSIASHMAPGDTQIKGISKRALARLLGEFGETRTLSSVAGRSNRGARKAIVDFLRRLPTLRLEAMAAEDRVDVIQAMQQHMVTHFVAKYFAARRVRAVYDANAPTWMSISSAIRDAQSNGKGGAVAQYLVGAKLALRFPQHEHEIANERFTTGDVQTQRPGDFLLGNTAFHVTTAPMPELFEKCRSNFEHGLRVYLLVLSKQLTGTRQNAEMMKLNIAVESIESFVATNLDELAEFNGERLKSGLRRLIEKYNERVDAIDDDKSLLIEMPPNLV